MTRDEQLKIYSEVNSKLTNLSKSKGEDYAGEDVLSNFLNLADACKALQIDTTSPVGVSLFFQLHKIARIANLTKSGKKPNNEGIEDSFLDLIGYTMLSYCNYIDNTKCCGNWDSDGVCRPECSKCKESDGWLIGLQNVCTPEYNTPISSNQQNALDGKKLKPFSKIVDDLFALKTILLRYGLIDETPSSASFIGDKFEIKTENIKGHSFIAFNLTPQPEGYNLHKDFIELLGYTLD